MNLFLYGPPGSGKSTVGRNLADTLNLPFIDLDQFIAEKTGETIPNLFSTQGETGFRQIETDFLLQSVAQHKGVFALGGGSLLNPENRKLVEGSGKVICLHVSYQTLLSRIINQSEYRPLLAENPEEQLLGLLSHRAEHYASFPFQVECGGNPVEKIVWELQTRLGRFSISGMGESYDVFIDNGGILNSGELFMERNLSGPLLIVTDLNVGRHYANQVIQSCSAKGYKGTLFSIPPGEYSKNLHTLEKTWEAMLSAGLDRSSTVLALGGGVVSDLAGFAAATFMRGIRWVVFPTTVLAMADASMGGKTGIDLERGKNLIGAFHPPSIVMADPQVLATLPEDEYRAGMAEVIKAGIIGDPELFSLCKAGWETVKSNLTEVISRAMAVKAQIIRIDPFEKSVRAALNLGHTLGHAIEHASGFSIRHGESVAMGLVAEARLSEELGFGHPGIAEVIKETLLALELPVYIPDHLDLNLIIERLPSDKKKSGGRLQFSLPVQIGEVRCSIPIDDIGFLRKILSEMTSAQ